MARFGRALGMAAAVFAASQARADLRAPGLPWGATPVVAALPADNVGLPAPTRGDGAGGLLVAEIAIPPVESAQTALTPVYVLELPPEPGSAALFLSAMISLGAWQLVRCGRDLQLGPMPEWYHTGSPAQIGHTLVFDLNYSTAVLCPFEAPPAAPELRFRCVSEASPELFDQHVLSERDPRGPPAVTN